MKIIYSLLVVLSLLACSKIAGPDWLADKKKKYSSCTCTTEIRQARWNGERVYEIRINDPVCNSVNVVYASNGTALFNSSDQVQYQQYIQQAKEQKVIWECAK